MHTATMTSPPNLRVRLSPELTPELRSSKNRLNSICSGAAYLSCAFPKPVSNSASRISGCFIPVQPRLPILGLFKAALSFFLSFSSFFSPLPNYSSSLGEIQIFPQKSKLEYNFFQGFLKDLGKFFFLFHHLMDQACDLTFSSGHSAYTIFYLLFINKQLTTSTK